MLLLDTITIQGPESAIGVRSFLPEEPYFAGHFPGDPIVPGVLLLEAAAQTARALLNYISGAVRPGYLATVDSAAFSKVVRPGDTLQFHATRQGTTGNFHLFRVGAMCGAKRVARFALGLYQSPAGD
jgi:3-hydroxyacyl-[acyl-carrier-protein] dehydratase